MAAEPEIYEPEPVAEEEPRYLRRQKPVQIRRRKFGRRAWRTYARAAAVVALLAAAGGAAYGAAQFFLHSPRFLLAQPDQIAVSGNRYVTREMVVEKFLADAGQSILRIPLGERRAALERIAWVEQATVRRVWPNRVEVEIAERRPAAFLRTATELSLIDAQGVILERPLEGEFRFPVLAGIGEQTPLEERRSRMQLFARFMEEIELARPGAGAQVSEVDLGEPDEIRATLAGLPELGEPGSGGQAAVLVYFGGGEFGEKFRVFLENIGAWRASAGRVDSVDLRFERQVVVNPEARVAAPAAGRSADRP